MRRRFYTPSSALREEERKRALEEQRRREREYGVIRMPEPEPLWRRALEFAFGERLAHPVQTWKLMQDPLTGAKVGEEVLEEVLEWPLYVGPTGGAIDWALRGALKAGAKVLSKPFRIGEKLWEPVAEKGWELIRVVPKVKVPLTGKTIQEMFQPAVERVPWSAQRTFRSTRAMSSLVLEQGRKLGRELEKLTPTERYEVLAGLRGRPLSEIKSPEARRVLENFEKELSEIRTLKKPQLYLNKFREQLGKLLTKPLEAPEEVMRSPEVYTFLKDLEKSLTSRRPREIQKALRKVIEDPFVDDKIKVLARDLYDLPYHLPADIAKANDQAAMSYLVNKIKKNPTVISPKPKEGFVESKHSGLKGLWVHKDVEMELDAWREIPRISRGVFQKYFLGPWKVGKVIMRPATHGRNLISNLILNDWGGLPFWRWDIYAKALKEMKNKGKFYREFRQLTGLGGTFSTEEIRLLEATSRYGANPIEKLFNIWQRITEPAANLYQAEEFWFKLAKYMHNRLERGMSKTEAATDAIKWTFNYGEITPTIAKIRSTVVPFFTWHTKVIPLMVETAVKHPVRFGKWLAFGYWLQQQALQSVGMTESEWEAIKEQLPDYIRRGVFLLLPWRDEKGQLYLLNLTYMLPGMGDVAEMREAFPFWGLGPHITVPGELVVGRKFSGAPLYYEWEDPWTKFSKSFMYVWQQLMPAGVPGGYDWEAMMEVIEQRPEAMSVPALLASQVGLKAVPISPAGALRRRKAIRDIHEREMQIEMSRELKRAKSAEEVSEILRKYRRYTP